MTTICSILELEPDYKHQDQLSSVYFSKNLTTISRIQLYRSIKSYVIAGEKTIIEVIFASEFCDSISALLEEYVLMSIFILESGNICTESSTAVCDVNVSEYNNNGSIQPCKYKSISSGGVAQIELIMPFELGVYQLYLFAQPKNDKNNDNKNDNDNNQDHDQNKDSKLYKDNFIFSLLTDKFNVISKEGMKSADIHNTVLMSCFRILDNIMIKEDYGKTLGSHIYDGSIVLMRYINSTSTLTSCTSLPSASSSSSYSEVFNDPDKVQAVMNYENKKKVVLELGAGCALISIYLSKKDVYHRIIVTDKDYQLLLIEKNILLNKADTKCLVQALNWEDFNHEKSKSKNSNINDNTNNNTNNDIINNTENNGINDIIKNNKIAENKSKERNNLEEDIQQFHPVNIHTNILNINTGEYLDLIIGCDVLYDKKLAGDFFSVVKALAIPKITMILIAQKLRIDNSKSTVDMYDMEGIHCDIVWQEANVIIWKLYVL